MPARKLKLFDSEIEDKFSRENFTRIAEFLRNFPFLKGEFSFFTTTYNNPTGAPIGITVDFPHSLGFQPTDAIPIHISNGSLVWRYESFTPTTIRATLSINANSLMTIRAFLGRYEEGDLNG